MKGSLKVKSIVFRYGIGPDLCRYQHSLMEVGTDGSGGHKDNQNASGLGYYHYHHGMGPHLHPGGVCPYDSPAPATYSKPAPATNYSSLHMMCKIRCFTSRIHLCI